MLGPVNRLTVNNPNTKWHVDPCSHLAATDMEWKFQGHFAPGSVSSRERNGPGAKVPGSELARVSLADLLQGANWLGSEKAVNPSVLRPEIGWEERLRKFKTLC